MRYQIIVNGRLLMEVRYASDADSFIRERISVGQRVVVKDMESGTTWENPTVDQILDSVLSRSVGSEEGQVVQR